jgi:hypothetical protein
MDTPLLDHDFNNIWGTVLGVTELQNRPVATAWMQEYWKDPLTTQRKYDNILAEYVDKFEYGFDIVPTSIQLFATFQS